MTSLSSLFSPFGPVTIDTTYNAQYIFSPVTADINGDGNQDMLILGANYPGGSITNTPQPGRLLLGDGKGGFTVAPESVFPSIDLRTVHPRKVLFGDFNGDNRPDIFISNHGWDTDPFPGEQNRLYLSKPDGSWYDATNSLPQLNDFSHTSAVGDINHDGDLDIFVGNGYGGQNSIYSYVLDNNGSGAFSLSRTNIPGTGSSLDFVNGPHHFPGATLADLNGDNLPELIITADSSTSYDKNRNSVILWNHAGVFRETDMTLLPVPANISTQIALDAKSININGDGLLDIVVVGTQGQPFYDGWFVQILLNEGGQKFVDMTSTYLLPSDSWGGTHGSVANAPWAMWVNVVDFNHDGIPDFSVELNGALKPSTPLIWLNDGTGHFTTLKVGDFVDAGQEFLIGNGHLYETTNGYSFVGPQQQNGNGGLKNIGLVAIAPYTTRIQSDGSSLLFGDTGSDTFAGGPGNDTIDGGAGIDTARYSGNILNYILTKGASSYTVQAKTGTDGFDTLTNVERLQFSDTNLAIDMDVTQAGGEAALLIGAVVGKASLTDRALVGQLIAFFDSGHTMHDAANVLVNAGIMDQLAGGSSTNAYVNLIYHAVTGQTATPNVTAQLAAYIDNGGYTKADFLSVIANLQLNQDNVGLVGLQQVGIEYS